MQTLVNQKGDAPFLLVVCPLGYSQPTTKAWLGRKNILPTQGFLTLAVGIVLLTTSSSLAFSSNL